MAGDSQERDRIAEMPARDVAGRSGGLIDSGMTLGDVGRLSAFSSVRDFLVAGPEASRAHAARMRLAPAPEEPGCRAFAERLVRGLERAREVMASGAVFMREIWSDAERDQDAGRAGVRLFHFPARRASGAFDTPWVIVIPGGGYKSVGNAVEGFPAAAELNEAGYHAFVLSYRTSVSPLMPGVVDDLAQAVRHIRAHAAELAVDAEAPYAVIGFSAGGHLCAEWGTVNRGYRTYGLPKPAALVLGYAPIDVRIPSPTPHALDTFTGLLQASAPATGLEEFCVNLHMDEDYPDTFLWQCTDDEVVSFQNLELMRARLEELGIPQESLVFERGGHALMQAHDPRQDRWMERVLSFLDPRLRPAGALDGWERG